MRRIIVCILLLFSLLMTSCLAEPQSTEQESHSVPTAEKPESQKEESKDMNTDTAPEKYTAKNFDNVKAMWLSQYDLSAVYTAGGRQRERADFTERIKAILKNVSDMGINTVYVQVRPFADSFYPSKVYPDSRFVSGAYGQRMDYDPFEIVLSEGHRLGLSVHAWINPLRAMTDDEIKRVSGEYDIKKWYDDPDTRGKYVSEVSGRWYLDPAYPETRALICRGAEEIAENYDVDGIHIDDYFYPTTDESFDSEAYSAYKASGGKLSLADFRRENINSLVRELYAAVKDVNETMLFGVSPAGVMNNNYNKLYADVAVWCQNEGYVDYICPQLYFGFEHATCAFDKLCREFSEMVKCDSVKLIFGMTLGKAKSEYDQYAGTGKYEWRDHKDILVRQLKYTETVDNCIGVSYFCYQYFFDPLTGARVPETAEEVDKLLPLLETAEWR